MESQVPVTLCVFNHPTTLWRNLQENDHKENEIGHNGTKKISKVFSQKVILHIIIVLITLSPRAYTKPQPFFWTLNSATMCVNFKGKL